ncbi:serine acetyltransferase [Pseudomonas sp. NPDC090592]|uniref:serine O-acetyltransferase n=1 Tax=Pseudomonas sp. NPDC090592 TaxID=3364480 RepID=UPI00383A18B4
MSKVWRTLRQQAEQFAGWNPVLRWNVEYRVLEHDSLEAALAANLGLSLRHLGGDKLEAWLAALLRSEPAITIQSAADIDRFVKDDPSCVDHYVALSSCAGFQALQLYRISHMLWLNREHHNALMLKNWGAQVWSIDIHPGAQIGKGVVFRHGQGLVIDDGVVIEDDVTLWNAVSILRGPAGERKSPILKRGATVHAQSVVCGGVTVKKGITLPECTLFTESVADLSS